MMSGRLKQAFNFPATMLLAMTAATTGIGLVSRHAENELRKHPEAVSAQSASEARADCAQKWSFLKTGLGVAVLPDRQDAALAFCTAQAAYRSELNTDHTDFVQGEEIAGGVGLFFAFTFAKALRGRKETEAEAPDAGAPAAPGL